MLNMLLILTLMTVSFSEGQPPGNNAAVHYGFGFLKTYPDKRGSRYDDQIKHFCPRFHEEIKTSKECQDASRSVCKTMLTKPKAIIYGDEVVCIGLQCAGDQCQKTQMGTVTGGSETGICRGAHCDDSRLLCKARGSIVNRRNSGCKDAAGWKDARGHDCSWYGTDPPLPKYGPRKTTRWDMIPDERCIADGNKYRSTKRPFMAADQACCVCGGGQAGTCIDQPYGWHDSRGFDCTWFKADPTGRCNNDARQACCACGGGDRDPDFASVQPKGCKGSSLEAAQGEEAEARDESSVFKNRSNQPMVLAVIGTLLALCVVGVCVARLRRRKSQSNVTLEFNSAEAEVEDHSSATEGPATLRGADGKEVIAMEDDCEAPTELQFSSRKAGELLQKLDVKDSEALPLKSAPTDPVPQTDEPRG